MVKLDLAGLSADPYADPCTDFYADSCTDLWGVNLDF
jgi:hypothetical protein